MHEEKRRLLNVVSSVCRIHKSAAMKWPFQTSSHVTILLILSDPRKGLMEKGQGDDSHFSRPTMGNVTSAITAYVG